LASWRRGCGRSRQREREGEWKEGREREREGGCKGGREREREGGWKGGRDVEEPYRENKSRKEGGREEGREAGRDSHRDSGSGCRAGSSPACPPPHGPIERKDNVIMIKHGRGEGGEDLS